MCNSFSFLMHPISSFWHPVFILLFSTHFFIHIRNKILTSFHLVHLDPAVALLQLSWAQPHHLPEQAGGPKETTQFLHWQPNFKIEIKLQIENFTATQNLNADLGWWCYWLSFRLPPSPQWLDRMLAVTLVSTLVVGLFRAILGLGTWDLGTP